eukprot:818433_1
MININHCNGKIMENMNHIIIICNCLMKRTPLLGKNTGWAPVVCENGIRAKEVGVVVYDEIFYAAYGAIFAAVYDGFFCAVYRAIFGGHVGGTYTGGDVSCSGGGYHILAMVHMMER